jgi:hypothetical protein
MGCDNTDSGHTVVAYHDGDHEDDDELLVLVQSKMWTPAVVASSIPLIWMGYNCTG